MSRLGRRLAAAFAEGVAALAFAILFFAFIIQIVSRYVFNMPVSWTLELCSIAYVWVVFWSCRRAGAASGGTSPSTCSTTGSRRAARRVARDLPHRHASALVYLAALPGVLDYIRFLGRRTTMLLHIRMDLVYACFAIFLVAVIVGAAHPALAARRRRAGSNTSEGRP